MLHDQASARTLGMARIWVFGLAAISRLFCPVWEISYLPDYYPVGVMRLLGAEFWVPLINVPIGIGIQALTIALLLSVAAGVGRYRLLAPLACIALTITEGIVRGRGVIPHAHMILLLSTYILCWFPAADALTLVRRRTPRPADPLMYRAPLLAASLVMAITYVLPAARRFADGGIEIFIDDTILCATATRDAELGSSGGLGIWACQTAWVAWTLRFGFPIVTLAELLSPLCIFSKRFRWVWVAVMVPFHVGTGFLMGIWFSYNILLIPLLMVGFDPFRRRGEQREEDDVQVRDRLPQQLSQAA